MKKNSLDIYWENKLDFKYEEEILRYKMLCNDKISKKLVKKYNINPKYNTFSDWVQIPLHRITDSASNGSVFPVVTEHFSASSDHAFL